jgi:glycosyltransferase involved in cell wall biosynthesis
MAGSNLLVISHPAVLPVNQLVYEELANRGYQVDMVVPARWRHEYSPVRFDSVPLPALADRFYRKRVLGAGHPQRHVYFSDPFAELRRRRPSVLFCEQEPFSVSAAQWGLAASILDIPFGVQMAENLDRTLPVFARIVRQLVMQRASFVAARSPTAAQLAVAWGARGTVHLVPHHVPGWPEPQRDPHDGFTIGYAGRLVEEKGLDTLVAAIRRLGGGVELLVAGDGPLRAWLQSADLGDARLRLVLGIDHAEMASVYAQMDVLVLASRTTRVWAEQFGRVLVEAMSCGTPVVGSSSGEIPWIVSATGGGDIFPEGDDAALAMRLSFLRSDPDRRQRLAKLGRERAAALFSVEAVAGRMEDVLREIAGA